MDNILGLVYEINYKISKFSKASKGCDFAGFDFGWDALFMKDQNLCVNNYYLDNIIEEIEIYITKEIPV